MSIPESAVAEVLVRCARHCCICRRFKPLHLHVHHPRERGEGGTDDFDNLIATCMMCHSDIHTQTKLTRRFTERELKPLGMEGLSCRTLPCLPMLQIGQYTGV